MANLLVLDFAPRVLIESKLAQQSAGTGLGRVAYLDRWMFTKLAKPVLDHDSVRVEVILGSVSAVQGLYEEPQEL